MSQITRRTFLSTGSAIAAGVDVANALAKSPPQASGAVKDERRNVLLLMADQHRPDALGNRGDTKARTPNLDDLARSGVRFDHAYCTDPVCLASRASLITGLYVHHHKAYNNETPWPFEYKTIAHAFAQAGYMTALVGKMHFADAQTHGFDYKLDFNDWYQYLGPKTKLRAEEIFYTNDGAGLPQVENLWNSCGNPWRGVIDIDNRQGSVAVGRVSALAEEDHFESFVARESIYFLRHYGTKRPFFLVSSFLKPHDPFMPAERFARIFHTEDMKLSDTWGKVDLSTVPRFIQDKIHYAGGNPELNVDFPGSEGHAKRRIALYYGNLAQTDDCVGKVLTALKELRLDQNTIVLYTADHGDMLSAHGLWDKYVFYEPSVGVPLIFRVPGVTPENARCENLVSLVQVFATLTELCGVPMPAGLDGASFAADLRNPEAQRENTIFAEHALPGQNSGFMIREGNFKYCYYLNDMPELYDLDTDPDEMKNLALLPQYKSKVAEMKTRLFAWYRPPQISGG